MNTNFRIAKDIVPIALPFGSLRFLANQSTTGASQLLILDGVIDTDQGHGFHAHPRQEEMIFVLEGTIEQWIGEDKRNLGAGDAAFIPANTVHATYNVGNQKARLLAILGPCFGDAPEIVDFTNEVPWRNLRS
jgi:quercetin dioxygenase-like cupin family protein